MKTNKVIVLSKEYSWNLEFTKTYNFTKEKWIELLSEKFKEDLKDNKIINVYDGNKYHICKYCGEIISGTDDDKLCDDCIECFGHYYYSEL